MALKMSEEHSIYSVKARSDGKIFSTLTGNEIGKRGQDQISVFRIDNGKQSTKRRDYLVMECFKRKNPHGWVMIRHHNGNEDDCRLSNLSWTMWNWNFSHIDDNNMFQLHNNKTKKSIRIYFGSRQEAEDFSNREEVKFAMIEYDMFGNWEDLEQEILEISKNL